jgi:DNA topoisomerase I
VGRHSGGGHRPRHLTPAQVSRGEAECQVIAAVDVAAEVLGNTRTVCRSCYVHPSVLTAFADGSLRDHWDRARTVGRLDRGERTVLAVLEP